MAVLPIRTVPDPVLRDKSKKIKVIDASVKRLIADMQETLHAEEGRAGLAAPQVGVLLRIIVISVPDVEEDIVLVNPEIIKRKGERTVTEGCLSIPGYCGEITRAESVTAKGFDVNGKTVRIKADGLLAQALEHETEHLDGILYIDHINNPEKFWKVMPAEESIVEEPGLTR